MKRKIMVGFVALFSIFLITGCGKNTEPNQKNNESKDSSKSVVVYFSATGTTKRIAERIASELNSVIVEQIENNKIVKQDQKLGIPLILASMILFI